MARTESDGQTAVDGPRVDRALVCAVRQEMAKHKRLGLPIAVWRDGRAVWLPADLIPVGIEEYENPRSDADAA